LDKQQKIIELKNKKLAVLREMKKYREDNKIEFFNRPGFPMKANPRQQEILDAWEDPFYKVFTYTGANRCGKTFIGSGVLAISTVIGKWPWNGKRLPIPHNKPRKIRIIGQDWETHIKQVVLHELEDWWPKNRPVKKKKNNQGIDAHWTDLKTGSTIEIMSNKQDSGVHEGWNGDLIIYDEPPKREIRVANARGLVDRNGRELFCMTLLKEAWVHHEVVNARNPDGTPDTSVFNVVAEIWDNVGYGITEEGVDQFIKTLTEDEIQARIYGKPSYMSGLVYPMFQRKTHLKERFDIPLDWPVDIAIDVHPREKQAILFTATSPQQFKYVFHEIFEHGDGNWVGEQIIRTIKHYDGIRVNRIIIDPLSKGDQNNDETVHDKVQKVLFRHGYMLETASKDKTTGILEIKTHMKGPNNEPSLFIFDDLVHITREIEGYLWDEDTQKPVDANDHFCENLYRTMLLNTKYTEPEEDYEEEYDEDVKNGTTGY
jgi:hypothetical protein